MAAAVRKQSRSRLRDGIVLTWFGGIQRRIAAGLGAFFLIGAVGLPGLGSHETRVAVDSDAVPWTAVVRLQTPGISRCTGFLIGPQTVVTAAHCLYGRRLGHFVPPASVHVLSRYTSGNFTRHALAASFRVGDGFDPSLETGQAADLAIVTLASSVAGPGEVLTLSDGLVPRGTRLTLGGYSQDRAERILADVSCAALGYTAGHALLAHDCSGTRGTSGGPLMTQGPDGGWRIVGVQVAGNVNDIGGWAVPAATIRGLLARP